MEKSRIQLPSEVSFFFPIILFKEDSGISMFLGRVVKNTTNMKPSGHGYVSIINHTITVVFHVLSVAVQIDKCLFAISPVIHTSGEKYH